MDAHRIYLSYVAEDAERVRPLRVLLEAIGMTVVTSWPEVIGNATNFVACFSAGGDGITKYNRAEVETAIEYAATAAPQWMVLVRLTPCAIPQFPRIGATAPLVELQGGVLQSAVPGPATFTVTTDEIVGGNAKWTNVRLQSEGPSSGSGRTEITAKKIVIDDTIDFTNVTNQKL